MNLDELGLDRNLYRAQDSDQSYVNYDWQKYLNASSPGQTGILDVSNPLGSGPGSPGNTVSQAIVQSSGSAWRVEINPDDTLRVHSQDSTITDGPDVGTIVTITGRNPYGVVGPGGIFIKAPGVFQSDINFLGSILVDNDTVNGIFYGADGVKQPSIYVGNVNSGGSTVSDQNPVYGSLPALAWTVTHPSTGRYIITTVGTSAISPGWFTHINVPVAGYLGIAMNTGGLGNEITVEIVNTITGVFADSDFNFSAMKVVVI